jgi:nucleotide-binding universal stress UspA family protein
MGGHSRPAAGEATMTFKWILVPILGAEPDRPALRAALAVARRFGGHVEALYRPSRHDRADHLHRLPPGSFEGFDRQLQEVSRTYGEQRDAAARRAFDEVLAQEGVAHHEAPPAPGLPPPSASWRAVAAPLPEAVAHHGGVADLVVVGRPGGEAADLEQATAEAALFGSACPVLLVPPGGVAEGWCGERVLIGWNRSLPAERAVAGARPFLERAAAVVVFGIATGAKRGPAPQELAEYLARHGIRAGVREIAPDQRAVGPALLEEARALGADLLVVGAYAQNALRRALLGGVTRHVLAHAELPVLMAH